MEKAATYRPYDMRRHVRRPSEEPVDYVVSVMEENNRTWLSCRGQLIDISEAGICIQTNYPLSPGHIVWFTGAIEDKAGFVRWCRQLNSIYKIGIELDKIHIRKLDEATAAFMETMQQADKQCSAHEEDPDAVLETIGRAIDAVIGACESFEREINDKQIISDTQIRFREKTDSILSKSYFINRVRTWPQGYQGDHKTLEFIYRNTPLSEGIGYYLDVLSLRSPLAVAVRNRLKKLEDLLRQDLRARNNLSVLNIACGSCREVSELAADIKESGATFTCVDLDDDALSFAADRLLFSDLSPLTSEQVILRKYNAIRMFDRELNMKEFGTQDIIYSVGLFDYLPTDFLVTLLASLYELVSPGGKLITSFKDASRYRPQEYHWISDWKGFLQRTGNDFRSILAGAGFTDSSITETWEESGVIVFYIISK